MSLTKFLHFSDIKCRKYHIQQILQCMLTNQIDILLDNLNFYNDHKPRTTYLNSIKYKKFGNSFSHEQIINFAQ